MFGAVTALGGAAALEVAPALVGAPTCVTAARGVAGEAGTARAPDSEAGSRASAHALHGTGGCRRHQRSKGC
jgi:hypothetical protein